MAPRAVGQAPRAPREPSNRPHGALKRTPEGYKGAPEGTATVAMDKTKVLLRLEADVQVKSGATKLINQTTERVNVTDAVILAAESN